MSAPRLARLPLLLVALLLAPLALSIASTAPAGAEVDAHPFGDPQTIEVGRSGPTVQVVWRVGMSDDLTLLGISLGVLPEDRVLLDGAITYEDGDATAVAESAELHDYLLEHIEVAVDGETCTGEVVAVGDLIKQGATLQFGCPDAAGRPALPQTADVEVSTLLDLHEAYRTLASGPDGQRTVYSADATSHTWQLPEASAALVDAGATAAAAPPPASGEHAAPDDTNDTDGPHLGRSAAIQMGAVLGLSFLVLAGVLWLRRHRTTPLTPTKENQS